MVSLDEAFRVSKEGKISAAVEFRSVSRKADRSKDWEPEERTGGGRFRGLQIREIHRKGLWPTHYNVDVLWYDCMLGKNRR